MRNFKISNQSNTTTILLSGRLCAYRVHCPFVPLEQPEFVDALNRTYDMDQIKKTSDGGCTIYFGVTKDQEETLVEAVDDLLNEFYRERIM